MIVRVETPELRIPIVLSVPLTFLKSRWIWRMVTRYAEEDTKQKLLPLRNPAEELINALQDYQKKYGHFNLVEVEEKDGTRVLIRI